MTTIPHYKIKRISSLSIHDIFHVDEDGKRVKYVVMGSSYDSKARDQFNIKASKLGSSEQRFFVNHPDNLILVYQGEVIPRRKGAR